MLQCRNECQFDGLALLVPGGRPRRTGGQSRIGVGTQPRHFGERDVADDGAITGRTQVDGQGPPTARFDGVQARARRDGVQPGAQCAAAFEFRESAPRPQQSVLQGVVGIVAGAEHAIAVGVQLPAQRSDQPRERGVVSVPGSGQVGIVGIYRRVRCSNGVVAHKGRFCPTGDSRTWHHLVGVGAGVGASDIPA